MHTVTRESLNEFDKFLDSKKGKATIAAATTTGVLLAATAPGHAAGIADVEAMVGSLGTIAGAVTTVVVGAMGVRYAIKLVNRVAVKG